MFSKRNYLNKKNQKLNRKRSSRTRAPLYNPERKHPRSRSVKQRVCDVYRIFFQILIFIFYYILIFLKVESRLNRFQQTFSKNISKKQQNKCTI